MSKQGYIETLEQEAEEQASRIAALEAGLQERDALIDKHWWWRDQSSGTFCVFCGASVHYDLGIDDIAHYAGCEYVKLRGGRG